MVLKNVMFRDFLTAVKSKSNSTVKTYQNLTAAEQQPRNYSLRFSYVCRLLRFRPLRLR